MRAPTLDLSTFDGRLLDGLSFCRKVYRLFEQLSREPGGIRRLRLRATKTEKRLIEELIPLARYVQARYREGRRIRVRWLGGSQPFDAMLLSNGTLVDKGIEPKNVFVEMTTSVHENEHLARRLLEERGGSFGVKGISRDKKTGEIISKPHVHSSDELQVDLATQIIDRLKDKGIKQYPPDTILIINCVTNGIILEPEWNDAIARVRSTQLHLRFREVFFLELTMKHSTTLYGDSAVPR